MDRSRGRLGRDDAETYALLDDMGEGDEPRSRLYTELAGAHAIDDAGDLGALFAQLEAALAAGLHAVGLFAYELGAQLQRVASRPVERPLAQVLLFRRCRRMAPAQVDAWLARRTAGRAPAGVANVRPAVSRAAFREAIGAIQEYIAAGDAYQVNYTCRIDVDAYGSLDALYARLRRRQRVPYGALIALPDGGAVLSLSPELFLRHADGRIRAEPMKGTARAGATPQCTAQAARELAADPKNRAENLMIVDLLRNDLGRIAVTGSVEVPSLFDVTRFGEVLQMTSTIEARLPPRVGLADLFGAMFPCGSITGAPKRRSMQLIHELEPRARGLYTGAIACFDAPAREGALPGICMSVPIRTLVLAPPAAGVRAGVLGVGAGIVADSDADDEFEECRLKAGFLTGMAADFELVETLHATGDGGCRHLDRHLARLRQSAAYFGFRADLADVERGLRAAARALLRGPEWRLRLRLRADGSWSTESSTIEPTPAVVEVLLDPRPVDSADLFLRHKSNARSRLDEAWQAARARGAFDALLLNERGELTQGGRTNVFVRIAGQWVTPPLRCGVLPGVMRSVLLESGEWRAVERAVTREDLERAEALVVCNAPRGALRARLVAR